MNPRFEKHNNQLFMMLEKPIPIPICGSLPILIRGLKSEEPYVLSKHTNELILTFILEQACNFEIIGTFVKEGSHWWALYQMMQGKKVRHKSYVFPNTHCAMNEKCQIAIFTTPSCMIYGGDVVCHANDWLTSRQVDTMIDERTGWQIYEPEHEQARSSNTMFVEVGFLAVYTNGACAKVTRVDHEGNRFATGSDDWKDELCWFSLTDGKHLSNAKSMTDVFTVIDPRHLGLDIPKVEESCELPDSEPEPQYKVGDWVECVAKQGQRKLVDYLGGMGCYKTNYGEVISPGEILRKLSPSEVKVSIGCLRGTVKRWDSTTFHMFHGNSKFSKIHIDALDKETRKLVEGLLEAQEKK